jgi:hypothetical protein
MGDEPGLAIALRSRFHTLRDYTSCLKTRELAAAQPSQLRWSAVGAPVRLAADRGSPSQRVSRRWDVSESASIASAGATSCSLKAEARTASAQNR